MSARRIRLATALLSSAGLLAGGLVAAPAEAAKAPKVSLRDASVTELTGSDGIAVVKAVLNRKVRRNVVVRWKAIGGTAAAGEDFTAQRGRVVIRKGTKRALIKVPVIGDSVVEQTEELRIRITKVKGAQIGKRLGRVQILDDDVLPVPDPTVIVADGVVVEGLPGQLPVLLSAPTTSGAVVQFTMTAGTATADDVALIPGQIVFAPGQQIGAINLATTQDDEAEDVETFTVTLSNATGAKLGAKSTATVSIVDDDGGASLPTLGGLPLDLPVVEGLPFQLPLTLSSLPGSPVEVLWEIVPGSADAADFSALSGATTFGPQQLLKTLSIGTVDDAIAEPTETATLILSVASGALPPAVATVPLRLLDNDGSGGGIGDLPLLGLGSLPTDLGGVTGSLPVPLALDAVAPTDVTGVLTATLSTLLGPVPLTSLPFTIPQGSLTPTGLLSLPLAGLPLDASALTLTVTQLTGAEGGDLTRTLAIPTGGSGGSGGSGGGSGGGGGGGEEPAILPALSFGSLPGSLTGILTGSLPVPLSLDKAAPSEVAGVLTVTASKLLGSVPLASIPFTIPQGATSPVGGLAVPLSSLPLGATGITMTVTQLTGATPVGTLTRTLPIL